MKLHASIQNDRRIVANAVRFDALLFLGALRGFVSRQAPTLSGAQEAAEDLMKENPDCTRRPVIYAEDAEGRVCAIPFKAPRVRRPEYPRYTEPAPYGL
jgi:hypothetical protein